MKFTAEEIKIANATCRVNGASTKNSDGSIRAVVPKYVYEHININNNILDYGAGSAAIHTFWLRENGFDVTAYEFGENYVEGIHNKDALSKQYKVIMASNVLNVQSSLKMLMETLEEVYNSLEDGGTFICNYPDSPRKMLLKAKDLKEIIELRFNGTLTRVGGSSSAPLWKITKPFVN